MYDKSDSIEKCNHCGGTLARVREGAVSCLMCGREKDHRCESCLYLKPEAGSSHKGKRGRKKVGALG